MLRRTMAGLLALMALSGILFIPAMRASAASSTVLLATVKESATTANEYVELSNDTANPISMTAWQICTSKVCDSFSRELRPSLTVRIGATELPKWTQAGGLNHDADLVCIVDDKGAVVDCINWGVPNSSWPNYAKFNTAGPLVSPGLTVPANSSSEDLLIFRTRTTSVTDDDKLDQWVIRAQVVRTTTPTPGAGGSSGGTTTSPTSTPTGRPSTIPTTGAEFPVIVVVVLIALLIGVRYLRSSRLARR